MSIARKSVTLKAKQARGLQISDLLLDSRNVQILALLAGNPRMSVSELARSVAMSAPATRERIQRMEEAGVIRGYRLEIDPVALGYPITAIIRVRPMPGKLPKIAELAVAMPQVMECHRITGEDCFVLKVGLDSLDNLDVILDQFLVYGQTTTSIVQSTPVAPRHLPLPGKR
jgi:Lrp/AsnC family transcriptional regulator, leucine-responsive regulatory protein